MQYAAVFVSNDRSVPKARHLVNQLRLCIEGFGPRIVEIVLLRLTLLMKTIGLT